MNETTLLNQRLPVRIDWWRKLARCFGLISYTPDVLTTYLREYSRAHQLGGNGFLTPELRHALVDEFDALKLSLVGKQLGTRLIASTANESALYDRCEAIVRGADGLTFVTPFVPQVLAIRGVELKDDGIYQTGSAARFAAHPYGERDHFSSNKPRFLDSVMVLFWRDSTKHACVFRATVNPNCVWSAGTAHLCDGQYTFKLGRHRTYSRAHIDGVQKACTSWPNHWIYETDDEHVRYIALEGTSPVNVIRSHDDSLDISDDDILRAEIGIREFSTTYIDTNKIKINIHTCPYECASSLGCQNVCIEEYATFIEAIERLEATSRERFGYSHETWYSLIDASKIDD